MRLRFPLLLGAITLLSGGLGACVASSDPKPGPSCGSCEALQATCGTPTDACGQVLECGPPCEEPQPTEPPPPHSTGLPRLGHVFGAVPTGVTAADAKAAYSHFVEHHMFTCPDGSIGVRNPDQRPRGGDVVSEGIAYGMLLAVSHNDQATFDGLSNYYLAHLNNNKLMGWLVNACDAGSVDNTAATDADIDVGMAYIMADCRWGGESYRALALQTLTALSQYAIISGNGTYYVRPGDTWGGPQTFNPSYFSPAYFRAFAIYQPEQAELWSTVAAHSYQVLRVGQNGSTGLIPDWMNSAGQPAGTQSYNYAWESVRYPWRIATDYYWWGTADATALLTPLAQWSKQQAPDQIGDEYSLDGTRLQNYGKSAVVGSLAIGTAAVDAAGSAALFAELKTRLRDTPDWYYPNALRALFLTSAAGLFSACPAP